MGPAGCEPGLAVGDLAVAFRAALQDGREPFQMLVGEALLQESAGSNPCLNIGEQDQKGP